MNAARESAVRIVRALRERGHVAYFAGGCVRDELLGVEPEDYDVATDATPDQVRAVYANVSEVGASFGVMLVRESGKTIEVATFRTEGVYSDKRRPDRVEYADAPSDARRRDFTINAMFLDPLGARTEFDGRRVEGEVIDYVGGLDDLRAGVVRAVGDPNERLAEDHLRALRAVRFTARLGFTLESATAEAVREHAGDLEGVSPERVGDEVRRMLTGANRRDAIRLLESLQLDGPALRDALPAGGTRWVGERASLAGGLAGWGGGRLERAGDAAPAWSDTAVERLVRAWRASLCLSNDERDAMASALRGARILTSDFADAPVARQKRWAASAWFHDSLGLLEAGGAPECAAVRERVGVLERTPGGLAPTPLLDGRDLIELGFTPGPELGAALDELYDMQLEGVFGDPESAHGAARRLLGERST